MNAEYLLFDLDGTIVDSRLGIMNCFRYALSYLGVAPPTDEYLMTCIGPPLDQSFLTRFGLSKEDALRGVNKYRERYAPIGVYECELIHGAKDAIERLYRKGYKIVLATSKPEPFALKILEKFDLLKYFHAYCGSDFEVKLKTKTDVIFEALRRANVCDKEKAVMIGDRCYDVEGGKNAGIHTIGIRVGFASDGELENAGADYVAENFEELARYFGA